MKIGKVWGSTSPVIVTPLFEAHRLSVRKNTRCSLHCHAQKWNAFLVLRGKLLVDVVKTGYDLVDTTELLPGEMTTVPPGEYHQFRALGPCEAYEFYYTTPLTEDILRQNVGGKITKGKWLGEFAPSKKK